MSDVPETPQPLGNAQPFVSTTTPSIERANRLISVRANPGFLDIVRISQDIAKEANDILVDYPGWDPDQIMVLKARAQAAKEHHQRLLARINGDIEAGIAEQRALIEASTAPAKTAKEVLDQGDYVRQEMLKEFSRRDQDEMRAAGSYTPEFKSTGIEVS